MVKRITKELSYGNKIPEVLNTDRYPSLDGIRAVCIILVVFAHVCDAYKFSDTTRAILTQTGLLGVQVFFVISGFLITTLLLKEKNKTGRYPLKNFISEEC